MAELMQVIEMAGPGGPEVLSLGQRPIPVPRPEEVLIKVTAAGVNGPDIVQRTGAYPPPKGASDLLGLEISGTVVRADAAGRWAPGDTVVALTNGGGYGAYVAVHAGHCLPLPKGVSPIDGAGLPETFFTVWSNIFHAHPPRAWPRDSIFLAHGGAGGIGSTAIQLGTARGLRVFTTAAPGADCAFCRDLGAERAIDFQSEDFVTILRDAGGARIILDTIGGPYIARNIKAATPDARIVQLAFNAGSKVEIDLMPIMLKRITYTGSTLRSRPDAYKTEIATALTREVWPEFATGRIRPVTHAVLPFSEARKAHDMMEKAAHRGKIILCPDP